MLLQGFGSQTLTMFTNIFYLFQKMHHKFVIPKEFQRQSLCPLIDYATNLTPK